MNVHHTDHLVKMSRKNVYSPIPEDETEEQRLKRHWKAADEAKFGKMPDPSTEQGRIDWLTVIGKQFHGFFIKCGMVNNQARKDFVKEVKDILVARNRYEEDFAFELAKICLDIRRDGMKGKTVLDTLKEHDDMSKDKSKLHDYAAPGSVALPATKTASEIESEITQDATELFRRWTLIRTNLGAEKFGAESKIKWQHETLAQFGAETVDELVAGMLFDMEKATVTYKNIVQDALKALNEVPQVTQAQLDKEIAASVANTGEPLPTSDNLADWFPRHDESQSPDGPRKQSPSLHRWGNFWKQATEWGYTEREVHKVFGVASMNDTGLEPNAAIMKLKEFHFAKPADKSPKPETDTHSANDKPGGTSVEHTPPVGEHLPDAGSISKPLAAPPLNEGKNQHMEAPVSVSTVVMINNHRMMVTARIGETPEDICQTILNTLAGLRMAMNDEAVKSYASVIDGRDKLISFKGETKPAETVAQPTSASAPVPSNGNGANGDSGTVGCVAIEVGTTFMGGKPALKFNCEGYENPLQFAKGTGEMVKLLGKVKQANGTPFMAEDLTVGRKFGGAWKVVWKDGLGKDEKTHRNVIDVLPV